MSSPILNRSHTSYRQDRISPLAAGVSDEISPVPASETAVQQGLYMDPQRGTPESPKRLSGVPRDFGAVRRGRAAGRAPLACHIKYERRPFDSFQVRAMLFMASSLCGGIGQTHTHKTRQGGRLVFLRVVSGKTSLPLSVNRYRVIVPTVTPEARSSPFRNSAPDSTCPRGIREEEARKS